jgi:hypothetical protein
MSNKHLDDVIDGAEDSSDGAGGTPLLELGTLELRDLPDARALGLEGEQVTLATADKVRPPAAVPSADSLSGVRVRESVEELEPCCDDGFLERYVRFHRSIVT